MIGSISIPNTRFYLTSIDGKKWFITEYYRTAPFNPAKETRLVQGVRGSIPRKREGRAEVSGRTQKRRQQSVWKRFLCRAA